MFVEKEHSLNESDSKAELLCRQSMARAGFAFSESPASFHWSQLVNPMGDKQAALAAYEDLLKEEPENRSALEGVAFIYQILGNHVQANVYRKNLEEIKARDLGIDIDENPEALNFLLAKIGQLPQPDRVPASYIGMHFDKYAPSFDSQLCEVLHYKGHLFVEEMCREICKSSGLRALDIGCGSGLTGLSIKNLFAEIDGVDLSGKMLQIAFNRNIYSKLDNDDYHHYLATNPSKYDVITASDVLIYQGDLSNTFKLVNEALNKDGYFVFTVEKGFTETFCLRNTGRYQHNIDYIRDIASEEGFSAETIREEIIRTDNGQDVMAYVVSIKKT